MPNALTPVEVQTVVPKINTKESLNKTLTHCVTCGKNGIHGKYKKIGNLSVARIYLSLSL